MREAVPGATLDIYGEGAEHEALQPLIDARGLGAHVVLRGRTDDPGTVLDAASVFLSTSAFEGQGLSLAEALAHGCPVVAYDVRYGPRDLLAQVAECCARRRYRRARGSPRRLLTDVEVRARLAAEAVQLRAR